MLLTVRDAARLLGTTERQIYRWVDEEELPFQRIRDQLRFNRTELLEFATSRRLPVSLEAFEPHDDPDDRPPSLAAALRTGGVHANVAAPDRAGVLRAVVERTPLPASLDRELLLEVLIAREASSATAIGEGIALPHVRHPVVAAGAPVTVSVSYLAAPVAFGASDGQPVHTVLLIVSPTVRTHLQVLARLARALHDPAFKAALVGHAPLDVLARAAERIEAEGAQEKQPVSQA